ncbi:MAG: pitrilysin family protein [Nitrospirota bacterium]
MFKKEILSNGITVVAEQIPHVKSVSLGLWVKVGSRDEELKEHGISHFIEHMFFKGTEKRSAKEIAQEMDSLGGELNAFTSREATCFYLKVLDEDLLDAVKLLSDIFHNSTFDRREIGKEKQVVIEEINMVADDPEDYLHDLHVKNMLKDNPLGRPILGNVETVRSMDRRKILDFIGRHYQPKDIVIAVAGNFELVYLMKTLDRYFGRYSAKDTDGKIRITPEIDVDTLIKRKKLEQVHICIGMRGLPLPHKDRYALYLLNSIVGGSLSSRLFHEIRERRGLAYSIYSYLSLYYDAGQFNIYAATSVNSAEEVIRLIKRELSSIRRGGIGADEMRKTKNQLKGNLMLSMESTGTRMNKLAKDEIYFGQFFSLEDMISEIESVSKDQIRILAEEIFDPTGFSVTILGPLSKKDIGGVILSYSRG